MFEENVQPHQAPQSQCQPGVAEVAQSLQTHTFEIDQHRFVVRRVLHGRRIEERGLGSLSAIQVPTKLGPTAALAPLEFSQIGHDALSGALLGTVRLHQSPVGVDLAILATLTAPEKHLRSSGAGSDDTEDRKFKGANARG